ncbi:PA2779 family protein [Aliiglaciecola sp. M165]|uniref:PA2779 family protein n=1 Tax=Aliiglaciecola sp. M165 TaxID=2593649 RepID=UPI00117EA24B|nr:PA2779 family protein [Aliiglaciecola sp. M165]TRY30722.1 hypothetical protein FM019_12590 [Aliiglaciecola sp. M165]
MKKRYSLLLGVFLSLSAFIGSAHAEAISSATIMKSQHAFYNKQQIIQMVSREDVQNQLVSLGVNKEDAIVRINVMTDSELNQLNAHLNDAPAGGVVGAVLTVLAIVAILDLLGVTDVYPFIRPVNG